MAEIRKATNKRVLITAASGQFATYFNENVLFQQMPMFLTDIAGYSVTAAGLLDTAKTIIGIFLGPATGMLIDKTKSKSGKYAPWIRWVGILLALCLVALFGFPFIGLEPGKPVTMILIATLFITINCLHQAYQSANIGFVPDVTEDPTERTLFASARSLAKELAKFMGFVYPLILVYYEKKFNDAVKSYFPLAILLAIVLILCSLLTASEVRKFVPVIERNGGANKKGPSFGEQIKLLITNKPLLLMFFVTTFVLVRNMVAGPMGPIYFRYVAGDMRLLSLYSTIGKVLSIVATAITPVIIRFLGVKKTMIMSCTVLGACQASMFVIGINPIGYTASMAVGGMFMTIFAIAMETTYAAASDYGQWKYGVGSPAAAMAIQGSAIRVATLVAIALRTWVLNATGYKANMEPKQEAFSKALVNMFGWISILVFIGAALCVIMPLGDAKMAEIRAELAERAKAEKEEAAK